MPVYLTWPATISRAVLAVTVLLASCSYPEPFEADNPRDPLGQGFRPDPPTAVQATLVNDGETRVTWTSTSSPLSEAEVQRRLGNAEFVEVGRVPMEAGEFVDRWDVPPYVPFQYRIIARSGDQSSDPILSPEIVFDFPSPYALKVREPGDTAVALAWLYDGDGHQRFVIERREGTGPFVEIGLVGVDTREYDDASADPDLRYTYQVRAATDRYQSRASNELPVHHSYTLKVTRQVFFENLATEAILAVDESARYALRLSLLRGPLQLIDLDSEQELYQLPEIVGGIQAVTLNREHDLLIILGYLGFYVHRLSSGAVLREPSPGSISPYSTFALSPDGQLIAAAANTEPAVEWLRVSDGAVVKRYPDLPGGPTALVFSDDGAWLAVGTHGANVDPYVNRVLIWDVETDQVIRTLVPKCGPLDISMDHARRRLAVSAGFGCSDAAFQERGGLSLWSLESGEEIVLEGPTWNDSEGTVAFTHDGGAVMRRDYWTGLHLWESATGAHLRDEGLVRPFTSRSQDRVIFARNGFVNIARTGPFWVDVQVSPD